MRLGSTILATLVLSPGLASAQAADGPYGFLNKTSLYACEVGGKIEVLGFEEDAEGNLSTIGDLNDMEVRAVSGRDGTKQIMLISGADVAVIDGDKITSMWGGKLSEGPCRNIERDVVAAWQPFLFQD